MSFDIGTFIALVAMVISVFGAAVKYIDRRRQIKKEQAELAKKKAISDVERDSIVIRGAEGALLLMERTLKTANEECDKRISELEEEITDLRCENSTLKMNIKELTVENLARDKQIQELTRQVEQLQRRIE